MHPQKILTLLEGGDRRSIGRSDEIAALVSRDPKLFPQLFAGLWSENPLVRMRAADAVEKVTRTAPKLLQRYKEELLGLLAESELQPVQKRVRRHAKQPIQTTAQQLDRQGAQGRERGTSGHAAAGNAQGLGRMNSRGESSGSGARETIEEPRQQPIQQPVQQEVRWHLAVMIPRLRLTAAEAQRVAAHLTAYLDDRSSIVKTFALQGLWDLAQQHASVRPVVVELLQSAVRSGTAAMRARARKLLSSLERPAT